MRSKDLAVVDRMISAREDLQLAQELALKVYLADCIKNNLYFLLMPGNNVISSTIEKRKCSESRDNERGLEFKA